MKAIVIGAGRSGSGAGKLLTKLGYTVVCLDKKGPIIDDPQFPLDDVSILVLSPGVPITHPLVLKAKILGIPVEGEVGLALKHLKNNKMVAVTGSNGKTTTVLLTTHVLNKANIKAKALGNVGASLCEYALDSNPDEVLVIELSSFQMETLEIYPYFDSAIILNITPNHLDRHASMEEYAGLKLKLGSCIKQDGEFIVSSQVAKDFRRDSHWTIFEASKKGNSPKSGVPEECNQEAAFLLCQRFGVDKKNFLNYMKDFKKPRHRVEWIKEMDGVSYFNDSKASNVEAVIHAVSLFSEPVILIAGGVDKGSPYLPWIDAFKNKVKGIIVFGASAEKMEKELSSSFLLKRVSVLKEAVDEAKKMAESGDVILFSPGCSSYDQFDHFEHRGDVFCNMVQEV